MKTSTCGANSTDFEIPGAVSSPAKIYTYRMRATDFETPNVMASSEEGGMVDNAEDFEWVKLEDVQEIFGLIPGGSKNPK